MDGGMVLILNIIGVMNVNKSKDGLRKNKIKKTKLTEKYNIEMGAV
jgi:hypothetical protein